jgi:pyridoxamine 5'-phosphate oxidase
VKSGGTSPPLTPIIRPDLDPLGTFREWYEQAVAAGVVEPEAMALATATPDGAPSVRFVLLKGIDDRGVAFYTNYESRKGRELTANPRAALAVLWKPLHHQVRLEGPVERLTSEESDAYFASRSRGSRLGAWASMQSTEIPGREALDAALADAGARYPDDVPRPPYWGGFRLSPSVIEFWTGRPDRLHDREEFRREGDGWRSRRLSP